MVCNNCGSENVRGAKNCISCNFPLIADNTPSSPTPQAPSEPAPFAKAPEPQPKLRPFPVKKVCPQCRYELIMDANVCPMCSHNFNETVAGPSTTQDTPNPNSTPLAPTESIQPPNPNPSPTRDSSPYRNSLGTSPLRDPVLPKPGQPTQVVPPAGLAPAPKPMPTPTPGQSKEDAPGDAPPSDSISKSIRPPLKPTTSPFSGKKDKKAVVEGTIDPFRKDISDFAIAHLKPISKDGEKELDTISLASTDVPLPVNRAILDPENNTITSKTQAVFEFKDGAWYITDKSDQQTTFVRAGGSVKIEKGDIILMGNRKFVFDY